VRYSSGSVTGTDGTYLNFFFLNLESFSRDKILRQFNTNVIGLLDVTKAVLPHLTAKSIQVT
jgi:NADP-dependent 3-hydroxy acid dehydrogenase YdfG